MNRRGLLQGALGVPLIASASQASSGSIESCEIADPHVILSGLAGLDQALGGIAAGELACVTSPPHSGKTLLLLDWAARICGRYGKNVVFYSANEPSFGIARKGPAKGRARVLFADQRSGRKPYTRDVGSSGAIIMLDSHSADLEEARIMASWLAENHSAGCAALISDGWCTTKQRPLSGRAFAAEPWLPTVLSAREMNEAKQFAAGSGLPVVMGVQTASLVDDDALADSLHLSSQLRLSADHWLAMVRPELYVDSDHAVPADKNVVQLCGRDANWWQPRRSRLRFDERQRVFETVV
jgi:DnaB-like helicase C terminal domain